MVASLPAPAIGALATAGVNATAAAIAVNAAAYIGISPSGMLIHKPRAR